MSAARPVSVTLALSSPAIVTACPPVGVKRVCTPAAATSSRPLATLSVTVTGVSKPADSASATVKTPPTSERVSSSTGAVVGPVSTAASLSREARSSTVRCATLAWPAGTSAPPPQSKASDGTGDGTLPAVAAWLKSPPLASTRDDEATSAPETSRTRSSTITCSCSRVSRSWSKVTLSPASASLTCARVPCNCSTSRTPLRVTAQAPLASAGSACPNVTPPPPRPWARSVTGTPVALSRRTVTCTKSVSPLCTPLARSGSATATPATALRAASALSMSTGPAGTVKVGRSFIGRT